MKKLKFILSVVVFLLFTTSVFAGEWVQDGSNWKYLDTNGEFITSKHKLVDGKWYLFDENGNMVTGFYEFEDKFYYYNTDGTPMNGPINYNGVKYNISTKGEVKGVTQEQFYALRDAIATHKILNSSADGAQQAASPNAGVASTDSPENYLNTLPLSKRVFRLIFKEKGLNDENINHVLNFGNINWKEQALKVAKEYYDKSQLKREDMQAILKNEGFADIEVNYGTEMAFQNDTLSSGVGKVDATKLQKDYLDKMSLAILGKTWTEIQDAKKAEKVAATVAASEAAAIANQNIYTIKNTNKKTLQLNLVDDDAEKGKVKVKITLPVPVLEGPRAAEINPIIENTVIAEAEKYLEYNYYEVIRRDRVYTGESVRIDAQDAAEIRFFFNGSVPVELTFDLATMKFKRDMVMP